MIYILLPVHNRKKITEKFIKCLIKQTYKKFQLILIDDGSTDGSDEMVSKYIPETKVIYGDGNLWWAGALQKGYEYLIKSTIKKDDIVLIINDDTEFNQHFLANALITLNNYNNALLKSYSIDKYNGKKHDGYIHFDSKNFTFEETVSDKYANCSSTRGIFIKWSYFFDIGGFIPHELPHYLSDYEWTIRAHNKGYKLLCDNNVFLFSDSKETGYNTVIYENIIDFMKKYYSTKNPVNPKFLIKFVRIIYPNNTIKIITIIKIHAKSVLKLILAFLYSFNRKKMDITNIKNNF